MPKHKISFLAPAIKDLEKIAEYHLKIVGAKSAELITDKLFQKIQILENQPYLGTKHPDLLLQKQDYRKLVCNDYICIYKVINQTIYIYIIVHGATDYPQSFN